MDSCLCSYTNVTKSFSWKGNLKNDLLWQKRKKGRKKGEGEKKGRRRKRRVIFFYFILTLTPSLTKSVLLDNFLKLILATSKSFKWWSYESLEKILNISKPQFLHLTCSRSHRYYGMEPALEPRQSESKTYMFNCYFIFLPSYESHLITQLGPAFKPFKHEIFKE